MLTWIEIDAPAIGKNLNAFRSIVSTETAVMAVVKANAYGHGIDPVASIAAKHCDWLGVNNLDEALTVRQLDIAKPVAILGHTELERLDAVVSGGFRQVVYREDVASALSRHAQEEGKTAHIHLKIETGTHRQGIGLDTLASFVKRALALPNLQIEGIYTHFANIEDTLDPAFAQFQIEEFRRGLTIVKDAGAAPSWIHVPRGVKERARVVPALLDVGRERRSLQSGPHFLRNGVEEALEDLELYRIDGLHLFRAPREFCLNTRLPYVSTSQTKSGGTRVVELYSPMIAGP